MTPTPWRPFFALIPRRASDRARADGSSRWLWGRIERRIAYQPQRVPLGIRWVGIEEFRDRMS